MREASSGSLANIAGMAGRRGTVKQQAEELIAPSFEVSQVGETGSSAAGEAEAALVSDLRADGCKRRADRSLATGHPQQFSTSALQRVGR
jgi:hypothetical protein